jgi:hypothetical protein
MFSGVTDVYLARAAHALGRSADAARWAASGRTHAARFGSIWWTQAAAALHDAAPRPLPAAALGGAAVLRPVGGGMWMVGRAGAEVPLREMKGFGYLRLLVRRPGVEISALDLSDWAAGHPGTGVVDAGSGEVIDKQALAAYRTRLADIDGELAELEEWGDPVRVERLRDERDALLAEVGAATGLRGRVRVSGGATERARVAVRKAVAAAIERITELDPALGRLLSDTVRTGSSCRYDPDPGRPVEWRTD